MAEERTPTRAQAIAAVEEFRRRLRANGRDANTHRALGRALRFLGADDEAAEAELDAIDASQHDPDIRRAAEALAANDPAQAETVLRSILARRPDDVAALHMLADVALRSGFAKDAEQLARHALSLAPSFDFARVTLAAAIDQRGSFADALAELNRVSESVGDLDEARALRASLLAKLGDNIKAAELFREVARRRPDSPGIWLNVGDQLRMVPDEAGAVDAYRRELDISPASGDAWWSLANIKTHEFSSNDVAAIAGALEKNGLSDTHRAQLHFALGKALEDLGRDEESFDHYRQGNAIRARTAIYDPAAATALVETMERIFTAEFMELRNDDGCKADDPIFIVGLTRSGSTLIEQILASHSLIEGTGELPDVILLAKDLERSASGSAAAGWQKYPAMLDDLRPGDFKSLGEQYLERTRAQRKTEKPFFTDKMPNNWFHVGLIKLILPNAKIIDARRHPLACGLSNYRQYFAEGQEFTYDLEQLGIYYRDYVRLMAHFDEVAPGAIHRVIHERLLTDPDGEIRRLLDFLGLPFEEDCLRFYETKRAVRTVSAEQVRRPIDATRMGHWRRFEQWLAPLKQALGPSLETWDR